MDKFEEAFKKISKVNLATHIELWGEPKTEKLYFEAGQQSRQAEVDQLQSQINEMAEVGLSQESVIREKNKRIEELESQIKNQIETLKCASKSWVYTEREQNIMLSQADDLDKALRGEHE